MRHALANEQLFGKHALNDFRIRQERTDEIRKHRLVRRKFLYNQIINHGRIDLLMKEVLGYEVEDFHLALYYFVKYRSLVITNTEDKQQIWNLTLAPRGFGKSTCLNVARCILEILRNPR